MSEQIRSRTARRKANETNRQQNKKPKNAKSVLKKVFLALVAVGFSVLIGGAILFFYYASSSPDLDENLLKDPLSSEFLDGNLNVFYKSGGEKREFVAYEDIPQQMEDAILATEDVRFYSHHGMDFWRLGGAVLANFKDGFGAQGASTLTQQVIKNSFLTFDKTLKRKAQEAWLAFQLERKYEKDEIFEMYFNKILMSGNTYGVGTAADLFYGKNLDELELQEIAMLAGMPQSPNRYNPFKNPELAEKRRNTVLNLMVQHKKITKEEAEAAKQIPVTAGLLTENERVANDNTKYAAFVDMVRDELAAAGLEDILSEGVTIHTTLDPAVQQSVEAALRSDLFPNEMMQSGITVVDTQTSAVLAVGGGRNYVAGNWNFASDEKRQVGSTIKPILSYGPAIEYLNWSTGQTVHDTTYYYEGTKNPAQEVRNVDRKHQGPISMREALFRSRNIPAVKTYEAVGRGKAVEFASKLGIDLTNQYPSNALGGGSDEFSTTELAGAYAAFGNSGIYTKPHVITKIVYRDGKTEKVLTPNPAIAMKDSTAYMITDVLRDVLTAGTGRTHAAIPGLDVAGKSGTTSDAKDVWFVGYTTNYTVSVWSGYQKRTTLETAAEQYLSQKLFQQVMSTISAGKETARFQRPASVEEATIEYLSEPLLLASRTTPDNMKRTELFVKGTAPKEVAEEEIFELDAPTDLQADYNEESNIITLSWKHEPPLVEAAIGNIEFIVYAQAEGSEMKEMTRTTDTSVTFSGVEAGRPYTFTVVATLDEFELVSDPTSVNFLIEKVEEPIDEGIVDPNPNDENNDGDSGGDNGSNPGDGNGETPPSDDEGDTGNP